MNQDLNNQPDPEMLDEYDFSGGVRGKYVGRFAKVAMWLFSIPMLRRCSQIQNL